MVVEYSTLSDFEVSNVIGRVNLQIVNQYYIYMYECSLHLSFPVWEGLHVEI